MLDVGARGWVGVGLGWFQRGFVGEETKKKKKDRIEEIGLIVPYFLRFFFFFLISRVPYFLR